MRKCGGDELEHDYALVLGHFVARCRGVVAADVTLNPRLAVWVRDDGTMRLDCEWDDEHVIGDVAMTGRSDLADPMTEQVAADAVRRFVRERIGLVRELLEGTQDNRLRDAVAPFFRDRDAR